ncbi:MAG TPA: hypothetical protein VN783_14730 [Thermoanaerobaculia bacterium]|nr:hypothetical protein [Thermoanaerobaculia bacterium]
MRPLAAVVPLFVSALALSILHDPRRHPVSTLLVLALGAAALVPAVRRLEGLELSARPLGGLILGGAILLRLPLLSLPPALSADVWRYLWDGRVAAARGNPYALAPDSARLAPLRDDIWRRLDHRQVPTVYPPLAITAFSIASRLPCSLTVWKLLATGADLAACALLLALARRTGLPEARVAWYAWNPLVALEVAGMGHVDALGVAATVAAVYALCAKPRGEAAVRSGLAAAAGILSKLAPAAALPMWARQSGRPWRFLAVALGLSALALAPVAASLGTGGPGGQLAGIPPGLKIYGLHWEFDGPLYEPLWRLLDRLDAAGAAKAVLDAQKERTHDYASWNRFYPYAYPQLFAKVLLALGALAAVAASIRERDPIAGTGRLFGRLLLASATVYPWYLLWVLPWAALRGEKSWLLLGALAPLAYLPALTGVPLWPWVYLAIWGPFALIKLATLLGSRGRTGWSSA